MARISKSKLSRRAFVATGAAAAVATPAFLRMTSANAAEITLKLHHFLPPVSNVHRKLLTPWAAAVEQASGGKVKINIFPGMQLGGAPPQLYDQAKDGVADIVWTLPGYTAGRFPASEAIELPFVASRRGIVNARACQEFATKHMMDETKETQLLCFWAHDHGVIHAKRKVETMADLNGLKLRFPTRLAGEALKALGASVVGMPVPQVPQSLAQGVIDGAVIPWEVVPAVKVHELVNFHTEIPGSPTLYTASFFLSMNKAKYAGLPADVKKAIDDNSGMAFATKAGEMWDAAGAEVSDMVKKRGNTVTTIAAGERDAWQKATAPVVDAWSKGIAGKGLKGDAMLADLKAAIAKYETAA